MVHRLDLYTCSLGSIAKWVPIDMVKSVRVGTDFSGLETPCRALRKVGVPHKLVFASEKHKGLAKLIQLDFKPERFYKDCCYYMLLNYFAVKFYTCFLVDVILI